MIYELKQIKSIDGVVPCTHFELAYELNEFKAVGTYGIMVPATETEAESFQGLYGSATCSHIDMIIPVPIEDAVLINVIEKPADYALTTKDMIKAYLVYMDVPFTATASKLTLWDLIPV